MSSMRLAARAILFSVAAFVFLVVLAVMNYPGGTWVNPATRGYDLTKNYLCDLFGKVALNGEPNPVAQWAARSAMIFLALGLGLAWWLLTCAFSSRRRLTSAIRLSGGAAFLGLLALPFLPPESVYELHACVVFAAGLPGLLATSLGVIGLWQTGRSKSLSALGAFAVLVTTVDGGIYAHQMWVGGAPSPLLPAFERIAILAFLVWMTTLGLRWLKDYGCSFLANYPLPRREGVRGRVIQ